MDQATSSEVPDVVSLYHAEGSVSAVARHLQCSRDTVRAALLRAGIEIDQGVRYEINHHYFSNPSTEGAFYWAGYIAANASVISTSRPHKIQFNISQQDKPHLYKLINALESNYPIKEYQNHTRLVFNSKQIFEDLAQFGTSANRRKENYTMTNWLLHHELIHHFLRGWVDGRGGFYTFATGYRECKISGPSVFLQQVEQHFQEILDNFKCQVGEKHGGFERLRVYGKEEVHKVAHYLYDDATLFLERQKKAALQENHG